nr:hypothetical protein GCM10020093_058210 [Planobispora longispora]
MGPWPFLTLKMAETPDVFGGRPVKRVSRKANSSPATGSHATHEVELRQMLDEVYGS